MEAARERGFSVFKTSFRSVLTGLASIAISCAQASACDFDDSPGALDIGVAISGGGAMSATAIGALKVLEEEGIPVHCIVGTSMGGVVAGLYAAGYDADELEHIFTTADWPTLVSGKQGFESKSFRRKEEDEDIFTDYAFGRGPDGITLPAGYNSMREMRRFLRGKTIEVSDIRDFDDLPTPLRTIGTELSRGEGIALGEGDIVAAMVATMAVPGVYPAQKVNGHILVDGGMSKQIAIDVIKEMGADIVIAIDTTVVPAPFTEVPNAGSAVQQLVQIMVWQNWNEQVALLTDADVHIQPDLTDLGSSNFANVELGLERGEQATRAFLPRLREIRAVAAPPTRYELPEAAPIVISEIDIDAPIVGDDFIVDRLGIKNGDTVTVDDIDGKLRRIQSLDVFGEIDYNLSNAIRGRNLTITGYPRSLGSQNFQLGAQFSNTFDGFSDYELIARWINRPINDKAGELTITAAVGDDLLLAGSWFQPLGSTGSWYVSPSVSWEALSVPVQLGNTAYTENWIQTGTANLQFGRELGLGGIISADAFVRRSDTEPIFRSTLVAQIEIDGEQVVIDEIQFLTGQTVDYWGTRARIAGNNLDAVQFPTSGGKFDLEATFLSEISDELSEPTAVALFGEMAWAQQIGPIGVYTNVEAGSVTTEGDPSTIYYLGGFKRVSGFRDSALPATEYALARLEAYNRLTSLRNVTGMATYVGATAEYAEIRFENPAFSADGGVAAFSVYGAVVTPIGPAYLAYGQAEGGQRSVYFFFGQAF